MWHWNSLRLGRQTEVRFRKAMFQKIRRLSLPQIRSVTLGSWLERFHSLRDTAKFMHTQGEIVRYLLLLVATLVAISILDLVSALIVSLNVAATVISLRVTESLVDPHYDSLFDESEQLDQQFIDLLQGHPAMRAYGAASALWQKYAIGVRRWRQAFVELKWVSLMILFVDELLYTLLFITVIVTYVWRGQPPEDLLLIAFWAYMAVLWGYELDGEFAKFLEDRRKIERVQSHINLPEEVESWPEETAKPILSGGVAVDIQQGVLKLADEALFSNLNLSLDAGEQVAVVGPSGAGKTSLLSIILGLYPLDKGVLLLDGAAPGFDDLKALRQQTVWVSADVQLWRNSLLYNLQYGSGEPLSEQMLEEAELLSVIERLPEGMASSLGEAGRLVSGGEGQRVRVGRALRVRDPRLVVLDEPFKGVDRAQRQLLLRRTRARWPEATFLFVTHDVEMARDFDRILLLDGGVIVEDGHPGKLAQSKQSRFGQMLQAENFVTGAEWADSHWRRLQLNQGSLAEQALNGAAPTGGNLKPLANEAATSLPSKVDLRPMLELSPEWQALDWHQSLPTSALTPLVQASMIEPEEFEVAFDGVRKSTRFAAVDIERAAAELGVMATANVLTLSDLDSFSPRLLPALLVIGQGEFVLSIKRRNRHEVVLCDVNGGEVKMPASSLNQFLLQQTTPVPHELSKMLGQWEMPALTETQICNEWQMQNRALAEEMPLTLWTIAPAANAPLLLLAQKAHLHLHLTGAIFAALAIELLHYGLWLALGQAVLAESRPGFWYGVAILTLLGQLPLLMVRQWARDQFEINFGEMWKKRLFQAGIRLSGQRLRELGNGRFLTWYIESTQLEQAGAILPRVVANLAEIVIAISLLSLGPAGFLPGLLLLIWMLLSGVIFYISINVQRKMRQHFSLLNEQFLEQLDGHETHLIQQAEPDHALEDLLMSEYISYARQSERYSVLLGTVMPYGWLLIGFFMVVWQIFLPSISDLQIGVVILAAVFAFNSLQALGIDIGDLAEAIASWELIKELDVAVHQEPTLGRDGEPEAKEQGDLLLSARQLHFRYPTQQQPLLTGCDLDIYIGDRILLEGPSGGGKSTLTALLSGLHQQQKGVVLLDGLDQRTWGQRSWQQRVTMVPQFHENHVFDATLAFNLLMGRQWPPTKDDLRLAEEICRHLNLGYLIDNLPDGLDTHVGSHGWRLSQGEQSRLFLARALLQQADLLILDETFASLDPENMKISLETVLDRAKSLLVIAHP